MISFDTLKWNKNLKAFEISLIFLLQSFTVISLTPNSIEVFEQLPFVKCFQSISFHGNNISLFLYLYFISLQNILLYSAIAIKNRNWNKFVNKHNRLLGVMPLNPGEQRAQAVKLWDI